MGPAADMPTLPPTMMSSSHEDVNMGMLSMDNILSSGFLDRCLVRVYDLLLSSVLLMMPFRKNWNRVFEHHGGSQWGVCAWSYGEWADRATFWYDDPDITLWHHSLLRSASQDT